MIRLLNDIHLEFGPLDLPVMEDENEQILVLAGDIGIASKKTTYMPFLEEVAPRFREVIYIMGNHEHYHGSILRSMDKIKRAVAAVGINNIHVVEKEIVRVDTVAFVCSTMWASYDNGNPITLMDADAVMNDHRLIRTGAGNPYQRKFKAKDAHVEFFKAKNFIFPAIKAEKEAGRKVCVVTHHAPSLESIHPRYRSGSFTKINGAYASNLDYDILDAKPDLMVHGHTHDSFDYMIGDTRVVCNPRGYYPDQVNPDFDPQLILELN